MCGWLIARQFAQIVDFYLDTENAAHLQDIQALAAKNDSQSEDKLMRYGLEAHRLRNTLGLFREVANKVTVSDMGREYQLDKGDQVFCSFVRSTSPLSFR